ncbi:MAG: hypothetical protein ABI808_09725, partial [Pseudonocardiales bacterium]
MAPSDAAVAITEPARQPDELAHAAGERATTTYVLPGPAESTELSAEPGNAVHRRRVRDRLARRLVNSPRQSAVKP